MTTLLALLLLAPLASAQLLPWVPVECWDTLNQTTFDLRFRQTKVLAELGNTFDGIELLVTDGSGLIPSLNVTMRTIPPSLLTTQGQDYLALAVKAYHSFTSAVQNALFPVTSTFSNSLAHPVINNFRHAAQTSSTPVGNGGTYYSTLFWSLRNGPLVLTQPPYYGGYWILPFHDSYGQVFFSIGSDHGNNDGGSYLMVPPGWNGDVPPGITMVIQTPTLEGSCLGRTAINGTGGLNWDYSWTLQQLQTSPDDYVFPRGLGCGYNYTDPTPLYCKGAPDPLVFWKLAGQIYQRNGPAYFTEPMQQNFGKLGLSQQYGFVSDGLSSMQVDALSFAPLLASRIMVGKFILMGTPQTNYWTMNIYNGRWGHDKVLGSALMRGSWNPNKVDDAAYYFLYVDSLGAPLLGSKNYNLTFPVAPPATNGAFWGIQALDMNKWDPLYGTFNAGSAVSSNGNSIYIAPDGSIPIRIQVASPPTGSTPASRGWNWVVAPKGRFNLVLRVYAPDDSVLNNLYIPPPVVATGTASG